MHRQHQVVSALCAKKERAGAAQRAAALARLGFLLSAAREPIDAAQHVIDAALEFFQWDASFLLLYSSATGRVKDVISMDTLQGLRQRVPAVLQGKPPSRMMRRVMTEGPQLVLRTEPRDDSGSTVHFGDKGRLSLSLMFVPVRLEREAIGVLSVQSYEPNAFNTLDLEILQGLADHAAGALGRLQAETELRASEERLRLAVESAGMGTWEYAETTDDFIYSEGCAAIWGLSKTAPVSFQNFLSQLQCQGETNVSQKLRDAVRTQSEDRLHLECRVRRPDQTERWIILGVKRFYNQRRGELANMGLIGTVLDITGRKHMEDALRTAQDELRARARELEETVERRTARLKETISELEHVSYALKHDMRAPLRAMQAYAQLVEEDLTGANPKSAEYLRLIRVASKRLDQLIQDSLSYNKAVLGKLALDPVNLNLLLGCLTKTYPQLQKSMAEIQIQEELPTVIGNEAALTQCFSNLLDNAVKFVQPGQRAQIRVWGEIHGDRARIWVEDQGIGIAGHLRERIFGMFERGSGASEGTGIGLAIARKLAQRMGGAVGVESEEGRGSRFWIELKAA